MGRGSKRRRGGGATVLASALSLVACEGPQSALDPGGHGAAQLAGLFWVMLAAAGVLWVVVVAIAVVAVRLRPGEHRRRTATFLMLGGGVVVPTVLLAALLWHGLGLMRDLRQPADPAAVAVRVDGELWWWRITYLFPDGSTVESANEVRLPVGERVRLDLASQNVIHSFWLPSIGGKMDLIPGRTNELVLEPTKAGDYRGQCAEYCGPAHALMAFSTEVMPKESFARWLDAEAKPAAEGGGAGLDTFLAYGCGACHSIRGTSANGRIGPDLTHVASRATLGAGTLPNAPDNLRLWIGHTQDLKPDVRMPSFGMIPDADMTALVAYLEGLK
ncbi:MAG: c-type cytochrome [Geminicoccaceae bacterium]|nr:c-type cytochrome [Geminicoccaceae bacterium]